MSNYSKATKVVVICVRLFIFRLLTCVPKDILSSFAIRVHRKGMTRNNPSSPSAIQDSPTYFMEQPTRLYAVSMSEVNFNTAANNLDSVQSKTTFVKHFGRSKASVQRCDAVAATYHREWNGCNVYSNIYSFDQYPHGTHKVTCFFSSCSSWIEFMLTLTFLPHRTMCVSYM